ncbi:MAG: hypothetical protein HQK66_08435 [Desulfamplus sp.]|nr:hypothetical protein [Desulfamplus sp.]
MPEIKHTELSSFLKKIKGSDPPPVFFIWGDGFLCKKVFETVIEFLLPGSKKGMGYELLEGDDASVPAIMERLATYSIFQERRVVALRDVPLFPMSGNPGPRNVGGKEDDPAKPMPGTPVAHGFKPELLEQLRLFIEKGFPDNHFLVMTSAGGDRRRVLFKTLADVGAAVDCTVPPGNRKADKMQQTEVLRFTMKEILDRFGKTMESSAFNLLTEMTGFDPGAFSHNIERLAAFIGPRKTISPADVQAVVKRTKKDAIYELNNAVSDRNADRALFYFKSLCKDGGFHHLMILAALANHFRNILMVKEFILTCKAKGSPCWHPGNKNYNHFMEHTMPMVVEGDSALVQTMEAWEHELGDLGMEGKKRSNSIPDDSPGEPGPGGDDGAGAKKTGEKGSKKKPGTDLIIAPKPKNGYPVYQLFLKSDLFTRDELLTFFLSLCDLDYTLKTSSDNDPLILLESFILGVCLQN